METSAARNAIAVIELMAATWPTRVSIKGSSEAGGNVESALALRQSHKRFKFALAMRNQMRSVSCTRCQGSGSKLSELGKSKNTGASGVEVPKLGKEHYRGVEHYPKIVHRMST